MFHYFHIIISTYVTSNKIFRNISWKVGRPRIFTDSCFGSLTEKRIRWLAPSVLSLEFHEKEEAKEISYVGEFASWNISKIQISLCYIIFLQNLPTHNVRRLSKGWDKSQVRNQRGGFICTFFLLISLSITLQTSKFRNQFTISSKYFELVSSDVILLNLKRDWTRLGLLF